MRLPIVDQQYLYDHAALHELVSRYFKAVDQADEKNIRSCFSKDVRVTHHGRVTLVGIEAVIEGIFLPYFDRIHSRQTQIATHFMGNFRIEKCAANLAETETYANSFHVNAIISPGRADMKALRYLDRMHKTDGEWRIVERRQTTDWVCQMPATYATAFKDRVSAL